MAVEILVSVIRLLLGLGANDKGQALKGQIRAAVRKATPRSIRRLNPDTGIRN